MAKLANFDITNNNSSLVTNSLNSFSLSLKKEDTTDRIINVECINHRFCYRKPPFFFRKTPFFTS